MSEGLSDPSAKRESPLEGAKKELVSAWHEAPWPEAVGDPDQLFHYCSADGLYGIVTGRSLWLSEIRTLNDESEMLYGREVVDRVLRSQNPRPAWLPKGMASKSGFLEFVSSSRMYVGCFCSEGDLLSQWRAYGARGSGFAIGFSRQLLEEHCRGNDVAGPFRVVYDKNGQTKVVRTFVQRAKEIAAKHGLGVNEYRGYSEEFMFWLTAFMPAMKNPSFSEEKEWRLFRIHPEGTPEFRPTHGAIIPYLTMSNIPPRVFSSVILGPTVEPDFGLRPMKLFLEHNRLEHVEVRRSQVPLRALTA
jgi:hypothetical protein